MTTDGTAVSINSVSLEIAAMRVFRLTLPLLSRRETVAMVEWMRACLRDEAIKYADDEPLPREMP